MALEREAIQEEVKLVEAREQERVKRSVGRYMKRWRSRLIWGAFRKWREVVVAYAQEDFRDEIEILRTELEVRTLEREEALEHSLTSVGDTKNLLLDEDECSSKNGEDDLGRGSRAAALQAAGDRLDALVAARRATWGGNESVRRDGNFHGRSASILCSPRDASTRSAVDGLMSLQAQLDDLENLVVSVTESTALMAAEDEPLHSSGSAPEGKESGSGDGTVRI